MTRCDPNHSLLQTYTETTPSLLAETPRSTVWSPPLNHAHFSLMQMTLQFSYSMSRAVSVYPKMGMGSFLCSVVLCASRVTFSVNQ